MPELAAIRATFADWRTVKSRKQLQIIFEVPLEQQGEVLKYLGAPVPDSPKWVGIALLKAEPKTQEGSKPDQTPGQKARTRSALLPKEPAFRNWVSAKWNGKHVDEDQAAQFIRNICEVPSRRDIAVRPEALAKFHALDMEYRQATGQMAERRG